jgi:hypothetical protein
MKTSIDLSLVTESYKGLWVVLNKTQDKVISAHKSAKKAYDEAIKKGIVSPLLFKVPQNNLPYFGASISYGKI